MCRHNLSFLVVLFWLLPWGVAEGVDYARWYPYDQASQHARQSGRVMLVYFWSHGCVYCEQMNTFVFSDEEVARALERRFVVASVDIHSPEGRALSRELRAVGTPTFIFLAPRQGAGPSAWQELGRLYGSRPRAQFLRELQQICQKAGAEGGGESCG